MSKDKSSYYIKDNTNVFFIEKPLFPIIFSEESKANDVLRRTKRLLNSTEAYENFIASYNRSKNNILHTNIQEINGLPGKNNKKIPFNKTIAC
jgi:hypothetical protein